MKAPQLRVTLDDGSVEELSNLFQEGPLILVFLRHFGCVFCRYQVGQLRGNPELPIAFVCMEEPKEAVAFKAKMRSPHRFICDPDRRLYEAFGVKRGSTRQMINLRTLGKGLQATLAGFGQGKPTSDPMQLSAAFIVAPGGNVAWSHYAEDASDVVTAKTLTERLERLSLKIEAPGSPT
ncbi:MAG: AhpC/TSA family protein [Chlorobia bacterium]|nr:AhpC/TSA family protein [Fimbriimonadaceae bacterium]